MTAPPPPQIFDRSLLRKRRARAAKMRTEPAFLHERAMGDIVDRLETTTRSFEQAIFYGAGSLAEQLTEPCGVGDVIHGDLADEALSYAGLSFVGDEELWPIAPQSVDLVVSLLTLHHANDLIGALTQMRASLKPDGLFIAALFGEETLRSLRDAFYEAETEILGGVSPRVSPFASVRDLGGAMQRAGFAMPVADMDRITVTYTNPTRLFSDLRMMGETSILTQNSTPLSRALVQAAMENLVRKNSMVSFDIIYLTGWAPHANQPKPLKPGSAKTSLAEAIINNHD